MSSGKRYRVILVAFPPGGPTVLVDLLGRKDRDAMRLPWIARVTENRVLAAETAARLRELGARVAVVEEDAGEPVFCGSHAGQLVMGTCDDCEGMICAVCVSVADGRLLCREHERVARDRSQWIRTRQLFAIFLFVIFLYQVVDAWKEDRIRTSVGSTLQVLVLQFAPPEARYHRLLRILNGQQESVRGSSLQDMKRWFDGEYERYTGQKRDYLDLHVHGPFFQPVDPPALALGGAGFFARAWRSIQYARYWKSLSRARGVEPGHFGARLYLVYTYDSDDAASHSKGSSRGRVGVVYIGLDDWNPTYPVVTVAHELAHTLGAEDRYDPESQLSLYPEGYVEPFVRPLFPQRYAELMAVDIPVSRDQEREVEEIRQVRVGHRSAAELGWTPVSVADHFYQPQADALERLYNEEERNKESLDTTREKP